MASPRTTAKIAARIKERAAYCIEFELSDPRATFITLTRVEVTRDLSTARIYYSVLGTEGDRSKTEHMLSGASGFIQRQVGRVLSIRRTPRLLWLYDESVERAAELERTIHEALEKDRSINPEAHGEVDNTTEPEDLDAAVARESEESVSEQEQGQDEPPTKPVS